MFKRRRVENIIDTVNCVFNGLNIAHVADIEFNFFGGFRHLCLKFVAHIVLLFFVARKYANFAYVGL